MIYAAVSLNRVLQPSSVTLSVSGSCAELPRVHCALLLVGRFARSGTRCKGPPLRR